MTAADMKIVAVGSPIAAGDRKAATLFVAAGSKVGAASDKAPD